MPRRTRARKVEVAATLFSALDVDASGEAAAGDSELAAQPQAADSEAHSASAASVWGDGAAAELERLDAGALVGLPAPSTIDCGQCVVTTSRAHYAAARAAQRPVYEGREWAAMVQAAAADRAAPSALATWNERKKADPAWQLTAGIALGGEHAPDPEWPRDWTIGAVLRAYGLRVQALWVGDEGL